MAHSEAVLERRIREYNDSHPVAAPEDVATPLPAELVEVGQHIAEAGLVAREVVAQYRP